MLSIGPVKTWFKTRVQDKHNDMRYFKKKKPAIVYQVYLSLVVILIDDLLLQVKSCFFIKKSELWTTTTVFSLRVKKQTKAAPTLLL